jgi:hypothetical protein
VEHVTGKRSRTGALIAVTKEKENVPRDCVSSHSYLPTSLPLTPSFNCGRTSPEAMDEPIPGERWEAISSDESGREELAATRVVR